MNSKTFTVKKGIAWHEIGGEILILAQPTKKIHQLNETAGTIWKLLAQGASEDRITRLITEAYDVADNEAKADLDQMIQEFNASNLIEPAI